MTKYYFAGASGIAVREYTVPQSTTLNYLVGDHLGSTSTAVNASTGEVVQTRYKAWGEVRWTSENKTLPTRYTFTGQYSYISDSATDLAASASFGLMFYNARWYDPMTGRFAQADTDVPGGMQGLDRYAYANNNPANYTDPSGHKACYEFDENGNCITEDDLFDGIDPIFVDWIMGTDTTPPAKSGDTIVVGMDGEPVEFMLTFDENGTMVLINMNEGLPYDGLNVLQYLSAKGITDIAFWSLNYNDGSYDLVGIIGFKDENGMSRADQVFPIRSYLAIQSLMAQMSCNPGGSETPCSWDNGYIFVSVTRDPYDFGALAFGAVTAIVPWARIISPISLTLAVDDFYDWLHNWNVVSVEFHSGMNPLHTYPLP